MFCTGSFLSNQQAEALRSITNQNAVRRDGEEGPLIHEGCLLSIEYCDQRLWLLLEPTLMITTDGVQPYEGEDRSQIGREDLVKRYNKQANSLLEYWVALIASRCECKAKGEDWHVYFPSKNEVQATFEISTITAYARQR